MTWTILPYLLPIILAAAIGAGLVYYAWSRRPTPGARPMVALALAIVVWSLFYALELGSDSLAAKVFWAKIQYLGVVSAPVAWFCLALEYTGREKWVRRRNLAFLSLIPLSTVAILWVQPALVWPENDVAIGGLVAFFAPTPGPGLGLALVQQIVMRHQGQVEIESEVDQGTTVRLWLPPCRNGHSPA